MAAIKDALAALEIKLFETATARQQYYYEISSDWNFYEKQEFHYLRDYIGCAMFGIPEPNRNEQIEGAGYYLYEEKQKAAIKLIYDKIVQYALRYNSRGNIFCSVIYNVIFNKELAQEAVSKKKLELLTAVKEKKDESGRVTWDYLEPEVQVFPVPVFKVKQVRTKCTINSQKGGKWVSTKATEKIFYIDCGGRVYDGFADYLKNNKLPKCTMVYPKDGKYQMDPTLYDKTNLSEEKMEDVVTVVWLESRKSPASKLASKVLMAGEITSGVVGAASMGVVIAAMFTPIGPIVAGAGGIGAISSGVWGIGRSSAQLADRGRHGESINPLEDRTAFGAWIGIAGGAAGVAASGSTALLSRAIRTGATISRAATVTYDVVLVGNLIINGVGISFKSYDMYASYMENKNISPQDVFMLLGHLFFFCNSVVNMRFAQTVITSSQAQLLKDYESSLRSNRHRQEFQRMVRNTRAAGTNDISSNQEIIRGINKINNPDEFFQAMVRNRKSLSASNARAAFSNGKVTVNSVHTIDPIEFSTLPREVRTEIIRNFVNPQTGSVSGSNTNNSSGVANASGGVNVPNSVQKPTEQAEKSRQLASNKSAGVKPNNPAERKRNSAVEPNKVAATQSKDSSRTQQKKSDEIKPNNLSESKSNIPAKPKLKTSSGVPSISLTAPKENDDSPDTILNEICSRNPSVSSQAASPQISDFSGVLGELGRVYNYAKIFRELLETGYKIFQYYERNEKIVVGKVLGLIVEFLWDTVKSCAKLAISQIPIDDPEIRAILIPIVLNLELCVEQRIDIWVESFKDWLEIKYPQTFIIPQFSTHSKLH